MIPDALLETVGPVATLTLERATFRRRFLAWREDRRHFHARYSWDDRGQLAAREEDGETLLYAYDDEGRQAASYRLDSEGRVTGRETWERDAHGRPVSKTLRTLDPPAEETWTYEHDEAGRMTAEKRGRRVRVEKRDEAGRLVQTYLYDGEQPDLVTDYAYDGTGRLAVTEVRSPDGKVHRRTEYAWDDGDRLVAERHEDSKGALLKDETYTYGAAHGDNWLERVTWVPTGRRNRRRRPREAFYRSFAFRDADDRRAVPSREHVLAFPNGVYRGQVVDGRPEGVGTFQRNDDSRYEGHFAGGRMEGQGRLVLADGRLMEGRFLAGRLEGVGLCRWPDGSEYRGGFREGKMEGAGAFTWADGTRFEGLFEDGRRTDQGAWERPAGGSGRHR